MNFENFKKLIPTYVINVAEELQKAGYEAYLVGGSIRDILQGIEPDDFDVATNAYPEQVEKVFAKSIPTGAKFGTITVITEDEKGEKFDVQVTTYRSEADYVGGRWPSKVEFARTIEEDLSRRDFTINAIALELSVISHQLSESTQQLGKEIELTTENSQLKTHIIDPFDGLKDLEAKIIRAVRDPIERFSEDGLRAVRACRLASQLEFKIEESTFKAIKETLHITKLVSVERFRDELMKLLLKSPKPSYGLRLMKDSGILELFIPELLEGIGVVQPEFHSDDVFEHSIKTVDEAEDSVKLAALFHDIGKPRTKSEDEKGIHFYGHDVKGAEMAEEIMRRLKFSNVEIDKVVRLARWHMFYYPSAGWRQQSSVVSSQLSVQEENNKELKAKLKTDNSKLKTQYGWTDGAIRRLIQNVGGEEAIDDLLKLRIADQRSNEKYEFSQEELDSLSERIADVRAKEMALKVTDLDITGHDLEQELNIEPGKQMGDVLKYLLEKVIDEPMLNKRETLLGLAKEYLTNLSSRT